MNNYNSAGSNQPAFSPTLNCEQIAAVEREYGNGTLVIIDMQEPFITHCKDQQFIAAVVAQVKLAIARGWAIVLIEVKPWAYGPTIKPIMSLLEGRYERFKVREKEGDDGSLQTLEACRLANYPDQFFRISGVLIGACVKSTAWGLVTRKQDCLVRVIKEACATNGDTEASWLAFPVGPRLVVSPQSIDEPSKPIELTQWFSSAHKSFQRIIEQIRLKLTF